jgi:catalase
MPMPKLVKIQPHGKVEELKQRYRQYSKMIESCHNQIMWLLAKAKTMTEVAEIAGYSLNALRL